jgi:hypothetical protein
MFDRPALLGDLERVAAADPDDRVKRLPAEQAKCVGRAREERPRRTDRATSPNPRTLRDSEDPMPHETTSADSGPAPLIPIVIGVVGHRDLREEDDPALRKALKEVFDAFDEAYKTSPKVLLSPLAAGADQLAADVALNETNRPSKWTVRAPLPFEPELMRNSTSFRFDHLKSAQNPDGIDFAARQRFNKFLDDPRVDWFVLPLPPEVPVGGRVARRRGEDWLLSPGHPGGSDEAIDWAQVVAGAKGEPREYAALRHACYANPGGYIVRHCHTLLALWDEEVATRPSGTAETVRFQLGGIPLAHYPWTDHVPLGFDSDRGPVIVIHTPRHGSTGSAAGRRSVLVPSPIDGAHYGEQVDVEQVARELTPWERFQGRVRHTFGIEEAVEPALPPGTAVGPGPVRPNPPRKRCPEYDQFLSLCQTIEDFNKEAGRLFEATILNPGYQRRLDKVEADAGHAFPSTDPEDLSRRKRPLGAWYREFLRVRETAGQLANELSPHHSRASKLLFWLLFLALLCFHVYAHPPWHIDHAKPMEHWPTLLVLYGLIWLVMIGWIVRLWFVRLDERRHDYRSLAEALRVRQAYALAGVSHSVTGAYLNQLRSELTWVRRALQHLCPPSEFWAEHFRGLSAGRKLDRIRQVEKDWVKYQEEQHEDRKEGERKEATKHRRRGYVLALAGLVILTLIPWFGPFFGPGPSFGSHATSPPSKNHAGAVARGPAAGPAKNVAPSDEPPPNKVSAFATIALQLQPLASVGCTSYALTIPNLAEQNKPGDPAANARPDDAAAGHTPAAGGEGNHPHYWFDPSRPMNLLIILGTMATILGGLYIAVTERLAHEELAKQYDRIYVVFRSGARELTGSSISNVPVSSLTHLTGYEQASWNS